MARFVREFAAGKLDTTAARTGIFIEARVTRALRIDSLGQPVSGRSFGFAERIARDFVVVRGWRRAGSVPIPDSVRFYVPAITVCSVANWQVGRSYLIFAHPVGDTLRAYTPCGMIRPSESTEAQAAFVALDSLLTPR